MIGYKAYWDNICMCRYRFTSYLYKIISNLENVCFGQHSLICVLLSDHTYFALFAVDCLLIQFHHHLKLDFLHTDCRIVKGFILGTVTKRSVIYQFCSNLTGLDLCRIQDATRAIWGGGGDHGDLRGPWSWRHQLQEQSGGPSESQADQRGGWWLQGEIHGSFAFGLEDQPFPAEKCFYARLTNFSCIFAF